jgi:putative membrane protein
MLSHLPYCGAPPHPGDLLTRFNLDPKLIVALLLLSCAHAYLARSPRERAYAVSGWLVAAAAFISPLCALSVSLFSARIAQHMVLVLIAAPLIALGWPRPARNTRGWPLWLAACGFFLALWFWHMPRPYDATFESSFTYWSMHVTLFGSGILLWRELLQHAQAHTSDVLIAAMLSSMQMGLLGAVLTFATRPLYFWHLTTTAAWGYTPLQDQQLGGVIMWVPGVALFLWVSIRSLRRLWLAFDEAKPT